MPLSKNSAVLAVRVGLAIALGVTLYMALQPHPPKLPIDSWGASRNALLGRLGHWV